MIVAEIKLCAGKGKQKERKKEIVRDREGRKKTKR
jgi:hypothetical protein